MSITRLVIDHSEAKADFQDLVRFENPRQGVQELATYLNGLAGGIRSASIEANVGAVKATGLITLTDVPTATDTVTIANVEIEAVASGAGADEFNIGSGEEDTGDNLAAAINASTGLAGIVTAVSDGAGAVTLTAVVPGKAGNGLALTESMDNTTVTAFANGAEGDASTLNLV